MVLISPNTNEWPQNQMDDQKGLMATPGRVVMDQKPTQDPQQPLKCPRCDSSNTKFCYYNNYSLSQPRHFCKACKRYWTRGGTLRNVPVGGGCRKNKRVKRPASSAVDASTSASTNPPAAPPQIDMSANSNPVNLLFYGLPTNPSEMNLPFPRPFSSRSVHADTVSGYDLLQQQQPQQNALGLGFSSSGFTSNSSLLSCYSNIFGSSSSSSSSASSTAPTMASLFASRLPQQKFMNNGLKETRADANHFQSLVPFEGLQIGEVKMEEGQNGTRLEWNNVNVPCQSQMEQFGPSDPSLFWNAAWPDLTNMGSSVTSLI